MYLYIYFYIIYYETWDIYIGLSYMKKLTADFDSFKFKLSFNVSLDSNKSHNIMRLIILFLLVSNANICR